jgi:hypothetical protein
MKERRNKDFELYFPTNKYWWGNLKEADRLEDLGWVGSYTLKKKNERP